MANETILGFVGLGSMGSAMAPRLVQAGHRVIAFDVSKEAGDAFKSAGGEVAASVADIAKAADIVFMSLPTPQIVHDVALGGAFKGARTKVLVDLSTTGPKMSGMVAKGLSDIGIEFVDSPVSGGRAGALGGKLAIMAACSKSVWAKVEPLLTIFGKVFLVGETPGQAQTMKLINNLMSVVALAATSEGMALGAKAGLDAQTMIDVLNASSGANSATRDKFPRAVLPRTFNFGFATGLSMKDVRLGLEEAERQGVPSLVGNAARTLLEITQAKYGAQSDFTNMARVVKNGPASRSKAVQKANSSRRM